MSDSIINLVDDDAIDLELRNVLDGFGFHICTAEVPEFKDKTALLLTPIDPLGNYNYTYVMSAEMIDRVVEKLQEVRPTITYTADDVVERLQPIVDARIEQAEGSVH